MIWKDLTPSSAQVAGGYITDDAKTDRFSLTEEQAFTLAKQDSPVYGSW